MDPGQVSAYNESIYYCTKLINMLERDKEKIEQIMKGAPLASYQRATDEAINRVEEIRKSLRSLQNMQQQTT